MFEPSLALILRYLSMTLSRLGRPDEALASAEEAVTIFRRHALVNPGMFDHDLTAALNSLAHRLRELDRHDDAHAAQRESDALSRSGNGAPR
jgi:hypothetical protein